MQLIAAYRLQPRIEQSWANNGIAVYAEMEYVTEFISGSAAAIISNLLQAILKVTKLSRFIVREAHYLLSDGRRFCTQILGACEKKGLGFRFSNMRIGQGNG